MDRYFSILGLWLQKFPAFQYDLGVWYYPSGWEGAFILKRIRVLTISKPYVGRTYRDKWLTLANDSRFELGLIIPPRWGNQGFEPDEDETSLPYWLRIVPIRLNGKNHFHFYEGLKHAMMEFKPDIVNVEEEHYSFVTWQSYRIARKLGAATLFYTWQNIYKSYPPPFSFIEKYIFKHSSAAVVGNDEAKGVLQKKGYRGLISHIPQMGVSLKRFASNGIKTREESKRACGLSPHDFWILFLGRLVKEKGIDDLIAALKILDNDHIKGLIIGTGSYLPELKTRARGLIQKGRIKFIEGIPSVDAPRYLKAADVLCLPSHTRSNWKEQFGRVLVEAMASKTVVVGSSSGEIPTVIGDAGLVFEEKNAKMLSTHLDRLFKDMELREELAQKGFLRTQQNYTNEVIAGKFADLFWEIHHKNHP